MDAIAVAERGTVPAVTSVRRRRRILLLVAAVILALLATAAAARFVLDLRGIIVEQVPGPPLPPESPLAGPELGTPLPLDVAAARAGMEPAYPADLGPPDSVWLVRAGAVLPEEEGGLLAMAWEPGPDLPPIPGTRWGAVLFVIDPSTYQVELNEARGQFARARAAAEKARRDFGRAEELERDGVASVSVLDARRAERDSTEAEIKSAEARVGAAELNLSYCTVRAPMSIPPEVASPQASDESVKIARPVRKTRRRPKKSASLPPESMRTAKVSA